MYLINILRAIKIMVRIFINKFMNITNKQILIKDYVGNRNGSNFLV